MALMYCYIFHLNFKICFLKNVLFCSTNDARTCRVLKDRREFHHRIISDLVTPKPEDIPLRQPLTTSRYLKFPMIAANIFSLIACVASDARFG